MSHQLTFADSEFSTKRRQTRKEIFLSRMEQILPWQNMTAVIEPFYPKAGNGRRPYPLETMLRIHCMLHWYNRGPLGKGNYPTLSAFLHRWLPTERNV